MVDPAIVGAIAGAGLTFFFTGLIVVFGFIIRRLWASQTEDVPNLEQRMQSLEQSVRGMEDEPGHIDRTQDNFDRLYTRLDEIETKIDNTRDKQEEEHQAVMDKIEIIVTVLRDEGLNGHLDDV